jgi:hypothetical protein
MAGAILVVLWARWPLSSAAVGLRTKHLSPQHVAPSDLREVVVLGIAIPLIVSEQRLALISEHAVCRHLVEVFAARCRRERCAKNTCCRTAIHPLLQGQALLTNTCFHSLTSPAKSQSTYAENEGCAKATLNHRRIGVRERRRIEKLPAGPHESIHLAVLAATILEKFVGVKFVVCRASARAIQRW